MNAAAKGGIADCICGRVSTRLSAEERGDDFDLPEPYPNFPCSIEMIGPSVEETAEKPENAPKKCDHICLLDDAHVERGELHQYGYELPSPRAESVRLRQALRALYEMLENDGWLETEKGDGGVPEAEPLAAARSLLESETP